MKLHRKRKTLTPLQWECLSIVAHGKLFRGGTYYANGKYVQNAPYNGRNWWPQVRALWKGRKLVEKADVGTATQIVLTVDGEHLRVEAMMRYPLN